MPVLVFGTDRFPAFWLTDSGYTVDHAVTTAEEIADVMRAADALDLPGGILVANPLPEIGAARPGPARPAAGRGPRRPPTRDRCGARTITPFLLDYIHEHTDRASVAVNLDIVRGNCRLGADIARAWAGPQARE